MFTCDIYCSINELDLVCSRFYRMNEACKQAHPIFSYLIFVTIHSEKEIVELDLSEMEKGSLIPLTLTTHKKISRLPTTDYLHCEI